MNLKNFKIAADRTAFEREGEYYDLHNCYDFVGFHYEALKKQLSFDWKIKVSETKSTHGADVICLVVNEAYFFELVEQGRDMKNTEHDRLSSVGFLWHGLFEEMGVCFSHQPDEASTHLMLEFESGLAIKVKGESVTLIV
ncbi:MAG: hypothetical protein RQ899_00390 [Pseudomonadales bacterium]|nr:hypothetical protein [Pseudomonadales bacterium]